MRFDSFARTHHSISKQTSIVNHWLLPVVGHLELDAVNPGHVTAILGEAREAGKSVAYQRSILGCLRSIMRDAARAGLAPSDPTAGFRVAARKVQVTALSPMQRDALDEVLKLEGLEAALNNQASRVVSCQALRVILWTGLRVGEALALRPGDYDPDARVIAVRTGKSRAAARRVDVPDCVAATLECYVESRERPHRTTLRRALGAACRAAGVPPVRIHDLRHTRVTTQLLAGVPVGYVSKQAGHASASTTLDIYDHWIQVASAEQRRRWANS